MKARREAFATWLATNAPDVAMANAVVDGFLALAGKDKVDANHVAQGVKLAKDAGIDTAQMEQLGALLVACEGGEAIAAPRVPTKQEIAPPLPGLIAAETLPDEEPPAPIAISIRAPTAVQIEDEHEHVHVHEPAPVPETRTPRAAIIIALLALAGVVAFFLLRGDPASDDGIDRVLDMRAEFPAGWRLVPSPPKTAHAIHADDAEAFVAFVPPSDDLVALAKQAEAGAAGKLLAGKATYYSEGCAAQDPHEAICRGTAKSPTGEVLTLQTFVRAKDQRVVLALFMAKPSVEDREQLAAAIVDSLGI